MKLIDFDGMFDEKLALYMSQNKGKHTEREWENVIPKLYKKFGDTKIPKIGCTPKEYYAKMTDEELVQTLEAHLVEEVPVPDFLCNEMEARGEVQTLLPLWTRRIPRRFLMQSILSATTCVRSTVTSPFSPKTV